MSEVVFGNTLHLSQNHSGNLLGSVNTLLILEDSLNLNSKSHFFHSTRQHLINSFILPLYHTNLWFLALRRHLERPDLKITLDFLILKSKDVRRIYTAKKTNSLPIRRLASKTVFSGFIEAWFFAESPTRRSDSVKAT